MSYIVNVKKLGSDEWTISSYETDEETITDIQIPEGVEYVGCSVNLIKEIICPTTLTELECFSNNLVRLVLNKKMKYLTCYDNSLRQLVLPSSLIFLSCVSNLIKNLNISRNIQTLYSDNIQLSGISKKINLLIKFEC